MKYRKKPVEIEAVHFGGSTSEVVAINKWMRGGEYVDPPVKTRDQRTLVVRTLEGNMTANPGDWIIKGVKGEFYPIKNDIFIATYEEAS